MKNRRTRGFSYVEVLIVMMVLALLFGLLVPGYTNYSRGKAALGAAISLCGDLQQARVIALQKENEVRVEFSITPQYSSYSIYQFNPQTNAWEPIKTTIDISRKFAGSFIDNTTCTNAYLVFGGGGKITTSNGITRATEIMTDTRIDYFPICINNSGIRYMVKVYYTGQIKWEKV